MTHPGIPLVRDWLYSRSGTYKLKPTQCTTSSVNKPLSSTCIVSTHIQAGREIYNQFIKSDMKGKLNRYSEGELQKTLLRQNLISTGSLIQLSGKAGL